MPYGSRNFLRHTGRREKQLLPGTLFPDACTHLPRSAAYQTPGTALSEYLSGIRAAFRGGQHQSHAGRAAAKAKGFSVIGYHFSSPLEDALRRNAAREGVERVPDVALRATLAKFERPLFGEGFDSLYEVRLRPEGFHVRERHHMEEDHEF